jgi:predicted nucleic acid-binding protein
VLASFYSLDRDKLVRAVEMALSNKSLTLQDREVVAAALGLFQRHRGLKFSDCLILSTARKHGHTPLGTFDAKLGKLDGVMKL